METMDTRLKNLKQNTAYLILIDAHKVIKKLSKLAGFSGRFGHIELLYNNHSYGCRYPKAFEIRLSELGKQYLGCYYEVREVKLKNVEKALHEFKKNWEGTKYSLYYHQCTDCIASLYKASGTTLSITPVNVDTVWSSNKELREYAKRKDLEKPNRKQLLLTDQFEKTGIKVASGIFGKRICKLPLIKLYGFFYGCYLAWVKKSIA